MSYKYQHWSIEHDKTISWATLNSPFFFSIWYFFFSIAFSALFFSNFDSIHSNSPELPPKKCLICRLFFFQLLSPHPPAHISDDNRARLPTLVWGKVDVSESMFDMKFSLEKHNYLIKLDITPPTWRTSNWTTRRWACFNYSKLWLPIQLITGDKCEWIRWFAKNIIVSQLGR